MSTLKEKDIVEHLIRNWDKYFLKDELYFYKKEYSVTDYWRTDIFAYVNMPHPIVKDVIYKAPVFIEVKYNHNYRDLIFELEKANRFLKSKHHNKQFPQFLMVIIDDTIDATTLSYIKENKIALYTYTLKDNDLTTLSVKIYEY